jgi:hypothetical protein
MTVTLISIPVFIPMLKPLFTMLDEIKTIIINKLDISEIIVKKREIKNETGVFALIILD